MNKYIQLIISFILISNYCFSQTEIPLNNPIYDNQIYHQTDHPPKRTGICNLCGKPITIRKDDRPHVIQRRIRLYQQAIKPVVEFYFQRGILINLDANGSSDIIQKKILEQLSH